MRSGGGGHFGEWKKQGKLELCWDCVGYEKKRVVVCWLKKDSIRFVGSYVAVSVIYEMDDD